MPKLRIDVQLVFFVEVDGENEEVKKMEDMNHLVDELINSAFAPMTPLILSGGVKMIQSYTANRDYRNV